MVWSLARPVLKAIAPGVRKHGIRSNINPLAAGRLGQGRPCGVEAAAAISTAAAKVCTGLNNALEKNRKDRIQLAASYRILERMGLHEGICNHLTMMTSARDGSGDEVMLLIPYGLHWKEVTASCLLGINSAGDIVEGDGDAEMSAYCIHRGMRHRHNYRCVFHIHPPYTTAIACLKDPTILPLHQTALRFVHKVAYDTHFGGFGDNMAEGRRLGSKLGTDKDILIMGNHGVLAVGATPGWAIDSLYYLERLATTQVLAMSTGREISLLTEDVIRESAASLADMPRFAEIHFDSLVRALHKDCPEFAD